MVLALAAGLGASAQPCPSPPGAGAALASRTAEQRLRFLAGTLESEGRGARLWTGAWGAAYSLLTVAQLAALPLLGREEQADFVVGAAASAFGAAFALVGALEVRYAGPRFAAAAGATPSDACALVAEGEQLLARGAEAEAGGVRWFMHVGNVAFNLAVGLVLGLGFRHWVSGAVNTVAGIAIGEANILTQPTRLPGAWARYQRGELDAAQVSVRVAPFVTPTGAALGLTLEF